MSDSVEPHRRQPTRLPCPWGSPGKNTGVGCHSFSNAWKWKVKVKSLSHVRPLATPWSAAYQAPPSVGFSRQEYWSVLPLPSPWSYLLLLLSRFSCVWLCATPEMAAHEAPWDSPVKNTGVGCHFLLQWVKVKSQSKVTQSCPTLSDPMDYSLPGSSIHGIFQARVLSGVPLPSPLVLSNHL